MCAEQLDLHPRGLLSMLFNSQCAIRRTNVVLKLSAGSHSTCVLLLNRFPLQLVRPIKIIAWRIKREYNLVRKLKYRQLPWALPLTLTKSCALEPTGGEGVCRTEYTVWYTSWILGSELLYFAYTFLHTFTIINLPIHLLKTTLLWQLIKYLLWIGTPLFIYFTISVGAPLIAILSRRPIICF